jgi:hypothetical protein
MNMIGNFADYEGACFEKDGAEMYAVERIGVDVLLIPRLEVVDEILHCDFETLDPNLSVEDVKGLIYVVLLGKFLRRYYLGKAKFVKFKNLASGEEFQNVYLG